MHCFGLTPAVDPTLSGQSSGARPLGLHTHRVPDRGRSALPVQPEPLFLLRDGLELAAAPRPLPATPSWTGLDVLGGADRTQLITPGSGTQDPPVYLSGLKGKRHRQGAHLPAAGTDWSVCAPLRDPQHGAGHEKPPLTEE